MRDRNGRSWSRVVVAFVAAGAAALAFAGVGAGSSGSAAAGGPTGTWLVDVHLTKVPGGGPPESYKSLITFTSDRTLVATTWRPGRRATGTGHGIWSGAGDRVAATIMFVWLEPTGLPNISKAHATLTLSASGTKLSGPFRGDVLNTAGKAIASGSGTLRGTRLTG